MTKDHSYRVPGGRVGVLLLHGLCGTPTEMRFVANGLARSGATVHCPQLAGHCGTEADIKATRWQDWYASAERALDEMRKDCDVVVVGGLSTGAVLSLLLAARRPKDVQGTILLAPTLWLNGWLIPWYARLFNLVFSRSVARFVWFPDIPPHGIKDQRIREFIRSALFGGDSSIAGLPSTPGVAVLEHRWLVNATKRVLGTITQPTLILHAREDDYADLNNASFLQRKLGGMVDTVVLDDSYHIITVDRQRHVVVDRATQFVERVGKQCLRPAASLVAMADMPRRGRA
ncbi:MAG: alpha/beta hydrolase [Hyphomicrobiaceae bacterium]